MEESRSTHYRAPLLLSKTALGASVTDYYPSALGQDRLGGESLFKHVNAEVFADVAGTLTLEEADIRGTWSTVGSALTVAANVANKYGWSEITKRYWRWKYVNGVGAQATFKLWEDKTPDGNPAGGASDVVVTGRNLTATTAAHTTLAVSTATQTALAANSSRKKALFVNDSDTTIYLRLGAAAVANQGIRLNANGGSYEILPTDGYVFQGAVNAIHGGSGTKTLTILEEV